MYINEFLAGILTTIGIELVIFIGIIIYYAVKAGGKDE